MEIDQSLSECQVHDVEEDDEHFEGVESELLDLLGELVCLRAKTRQDLEHESSSSVQKIPYPPLEHGFLPSHFMPMQSWLLPPGRAETGQWAHAMAPRPDDGRMEPLNVVLSEKGATLEFAPRDEAREKRRQSMAKEVFRRRRGRSRSPMVAVEEMQEAGLVRGRPRAKPQL